MLVVGDVMLDKYLTGVVSRISPEAPVPILRLENEEYRPGGAANVAMGVSALGSNISLLSIIGSDDSGKKLFDILKKNNVSCYFVELSEINTTTKVRLISHRQQLLRIDYESTIKNFESEMYLKLFNKIIENVNVLVISDYAKGTIIEAKNLIAEAKKRSIPVIVDPKSKNFDNYRGATVITPNLMEFEAVAGKSSSKEEMIEKALKLCYEFEFYAVLITKSEHGMLLVGPQLTATDVASIAREVYDVTGAGDTVVAVLAASLGAGQNLYDSIIWANQAAGLAVGKLGTVQISRKDINESISNVTLGSGHIVTQEELIDLVRKAKLAGEKIVMTNGCFDLIHPGHIAYLLKAKQLGNRLIVALNDDASVRALKGKSRPINSLYERMLIMSSLKSVDWVVSFSDLTPELLIRKVSPDILVKGADYIGKEIAGSDYVKSYGGRVLTVDIVNGYSTTNMYNKIIRNEQERSGV